MPAARRAQVLETRRLTPQMIRVVLGGEELSGFGAGEFTDHYVKLRIAEREQRILEMRFVDDMTQSEIAAQVGVSQMQISRLLRQSLERLHELTR